jgi:NTP pyrophosphatase (non-canonical NTP hydrolase)
VSDGSIPGAAVKALIADWREIAPELSASGRNLTILYADQLEALVRSSLSQPEKEHMGLTFDGFSNVNRERCESPVGFKHALDSWSTSDWFLAVLGELGEAANIAKKLNRVRDGIPGNKEPADVLHDKLRRELGDAFVYLDLLAQSLGISIGAAAVEVFNAKSEELGCPIRIRDRSDASSCERAAPKEK